MTTIHKATVFACLTWAVCGLAVFIGKADAQVSTVSAPALVQSLPLSPPPGAATTPDSPPPASTPAPAAPSPQALPAAPVPSAPPAAPSAQPPVAPAPVPPQAVSPGASGIIDPNATMAGTPGDPMNVDTITLPGKPALVISGQSTWDKGFDTLTETFRRLDAEAARLGLKVAGRPLTYFAETDDMGFRFDAMLPVDRTSEIAAPAAGIRPGLTPQGNALRFTHKGPYEDVDTTYEGITAYLDAKGVVVRDQFIEEYVNEPKDATDPNFEINIYVQPR